MASASRVTRFPSPSPSSEKLFDDNRFRALLPPEEWGRLPVATWRRFSKRLSPGRTIVYAGAIEEAAFSRIGWWLAQITRLIGGPLPTGRETGVPIIVTVTEDASSGQVWTRLCARSSGFPQAIHSVKRFAGPTGLEEYVGCGIAMALNIAVEHEAMVFRSAGYFFEIGKLRLALPDWLTPGAMTVTHVDLGNGQFRFTLDVVHPRFGTLIRQSAVFREVLS
jgi:Domain of unknown function (DUF4166)